MIRRVASIFRRFGHRESGAATVEFTIVFPVFVLVLLSGIEAGILMARQVMIDRALDIAVRDLRLGGWVNPDHDDLRTRICENTVIIANCNDVMMLELRRVSTDTWDLPANGAPCVDRAEDIEPTTQFVGGGQNDMMLVRACTIVDPLFPTTGLGLQLETDESGGYAITARSAFVNEPS